MAEDRKPPDKSPAKPPSRKISGAAEEPNPYRSDPGARYAPADNLYDAIRADVAVLGGIDFQPLRRVQESEYPFNDIDWNPFEDE